VNGYSGIQDNADAIEDNTTRITSNAVEISLLSELKKTQPINLELSKKKQI
jgi:hypothetical protein